MPIVTPDVASDVATRAVALLPDDWFLSGARRNVWVGLERTAAGAVPLLALFALAAGERHAIHSDGQTRELDVQLLIRCERDKWDDGWARARRLYDALHLSGPFDVGAVSYIDIRAFDAPAPLPGDGNDPHYFALNVSAWYDG